MQRRIDVIEDVDDHYDLDLDHHHSSSSKIELFSQKMMNRLKLDQEYDPHDKDNDDHSRHYSSLSNPKENKNRGQKSDRANRAVVEQVLDSRTRMILLKMINNHLLYEVNGCISTGKEANVYHALSDWCPETGTQKNYAIKIYKSTILTFKSREKYVAAEFRYRKGYSKHNPRKMVQVWAEKELRNLKRLRTANIPCPEPHFLKSPVLMMDFIGDQKSGIPAPRLKDAIFANEAEAEALYYSLLKMMRTMFQECKLVHADLSEYNVLYDKGSLVIIDVSQSVEHDHPSALDFLRSDILNVISFFRSKHHIETVGLRTAFDFITTPSIKCTTTTSIDKYIHSMHAEERLKVEQEPDLQKRESEEAVFKDSYIPRTLDEVIDCERDIENRNDGEDLIYSKMLSLDIGDCSGGDDCSGDDDNYYSGSSGSGDTDVSDSYSDDCSVESDSDSDASLSISLDRLDIAVLTPEEKKAVRKENKAKVKSDKKEKRKTKLPKHVKKRKIASRKKGGG